MADQNTPSAQQISEALNSAGPIVLAPGPREQPTQVPPSPHDVWDLPNGTAWVYYGEGKSSLTHPHHPGQPHPDTPAETSTPNNVTTPYNSHRPHQGIANARPLHLLPVPVTDPEQITHFDIRRRERLGGILHEYQHAA
ncbi:hypothetical protein QMK19_37780 [Streptomyces sp. H10-C2]|uniref:hypothetical protein n=1 Tax=unclassified Streptomyces TaxID=2593676 RepID=UPI0024B8819E|nr:MULTISPECIES: hypothetical protein [unclassified Streptomyces]MDJ0345404.1 hypothetical protein [Streptomyces sp. PH10-H1]MDJ0375202.1 hypothetical protein [Streptomyces sp. H10-C2]